MPKHQTTPHRSSKAQLWVKRSVHLKTYLQDLPRRLRLDVEALVKIFLTRRSLLLKLADNYLIKLWECSRATAQRRLERLEELGLLKRMTQPPQKQSDGTWKQDRKLVLLLPKKPKSFLVSHFGAQANSQQPFRSKHYQIWRLWITWRCNPRYRKGHLLFGCEDGEQNQDRWGTCWIPFTAELSEDPM